MQHLRMWGFFALVALYAVAEPASALTTTYYWGLLEGGFREDGIYANCTDAEDPSFPAEFPELCGGTMPAQLSVTFEHDQPIWDNDASGCDPESQTDIRCRVTRFGFDELVGIMLSGVAVFEPNEVSGLVVADFLGTCPNDDCEFAPPFIVFRAVDVLTGLEITVTHVEIDHFMDLLFADGRSFEDDALFWGRGRTVPEPTGLGLFSLGLAGLGLVMRRQQPSFPGAAGVAG